MHPGSHHAIRTALRAWAEALALTGRAILTLAGRPPPPQARPAPARSVLVVPAGRARTRLTMGDGQDGWSVYVSVGEMRPEPPAPAANGPRPRRPLFRKGSAR